MRRLVIVVSVLLSAALLTSACTSGSNPTPTASSTPSAVASPPGPVDYDGLETAIEAKIVSGGTGWTSIGAVLVSVDGTTEIAHYRNGRTPDDALHIWSSTASVAAILVGIALDEHIIGSLDQTLAELLPRYAEDLTDETGAITLRELMAMTSGLPYDYAIDNVALIFEGKGDPVPRILREGLQVPPGQYFYSSRSAHLVSAVLREALARADGDRARSVLTYAREKLFDPLGIDSTPALEERVRLTEPDYDALTEFGWGVDGAGLNTACCLLRLRPADMVKIGELYLGQGTWHGKRIVSPEWVAETTRPGEASADFGLMWFVHTINGRPVWLTRGGEGQMIAVVPDRKLVVAVGSAPTEGNDIPEYDVSFLLAEVILPAFG